MPSRIVFQRGSLRPAHFIFAAALLVRWIALARLASSNLLNPTGSDMLFYDDWARRLLRGEVTDHLAFYGLPLYAWWLAAIYKLVGFGAFAPLLLQSFVDAGTALLIYKIAVVVCDDDARARLTGTIAAFGWILCTPAQAYAASLLPTSLGVFVLWFIVWQIIRINSAPSARVSLFLGLLIGVTAMAVANALIAAPLLAAAAFRSATWTRRIAAIASLTGGIALGTSPCWIHNCFVARDPVFLSAHSGVNFWIGNNPDATGYPHFPGMRSGQADLLADSIEVAESAAGHPLRRSQVSQYWSGKARSFIFAEPLQWLRVCARKVANYWNAFEYDDVGVIESLRRAGIVLPGVHFGLIASLGVPGFVIGLGGFRKAGWIAAALLLQMFSVVALFITERYRLAAIPGLLIFAAVTITYLARAIVVAQWLRAAATVAAVVFVAFVVSTPRTAASLWALNAYNSGREALASRDLKTAELELARSRQYVPDNPETNFALGNLRLAQENREAARAFYLRTLQLAPRHKGALTNLGVLALDTHDYAAARNHFTRAVAAAPGDAKAHYLLAKSAYLMGDTQTATREVERAIALNHAQPEFVALRDEIRKASAPHGE
jgi:tetratricopeptide (TPR) repeat protein